MRKKALLSHALALGILSFGAVAHAADATRSAKPTVVFVHGAFADGSSWSKVIPILQAQGIKTVAVQNALDSLDGDVAATRRAIEDQPGRVVLVGHSWGGTVITQAGIHDRVAALVYVAAFAPSVGQSSGELGKDYPPAPGLANLVPDKAGYLWLPDEVLRQHFAQDLGKSELDLMVATQGPVQAKAFDEKVTTAAWTSKPSWYIVAENDHMIVPDLQRALAKKIGAKVTSLPTSHVPMQSRPVDVAKVILAAVAAMSK